MSADSEIIDRAFAGQRRQLPDGPYFSPRALAAFLAITEAKVWRMIDEGCFEAWPDGIDVRIYERDVERYLQSVYEPAVDDGEVVDRRTPTPHLGNYEKWSPDERDFALVLVRDPCSYCGGRTQAVDHIRPRARGGDHAWTNFTAACTRCNSGKNARSLLLFLLQRVAA